ncbi:MAG: NmrA family NAD(P)-binding protein [Jatrophihabitans sp.]
MILVTGATGTVGGAVVDALHDQGVAVRALVRNPTTAELPDDVEVVAGDLTDAAALDVALKGADSVLLVWPLLTIAPLGIFLDVARTHHVHVVFLSANGVDDAGQFVDPTTFHGDIERALKAAGLPHTFVRPSGFATNTLMWAEQIRAEGKVRWPFAEAARTLIHERDIGAVAAQALRAKAVGAVHRITGPTAITQAEQVRIIGAAIGRELPYEDMPVEEGRRLLMDAWGDVDFVESAVATWATFVRTPEPSTNEVAEMLGRPALPFAAWAADHAADFR